MWKCQYDTFDDDPNREQIILSSIMHSADVLMCVCVLF